MADTRQIFHSYILRYWAEQVDDEGQQIWRFTLEGADNHQRIGFANLDKMVAWLDQETILSKADTK